MIGCGPLQGCPFDYKGSDYDKVWQLRYLLTKTTESPHGGKSRSHHRNSKPVITWEVYGTTLDEGYDPLAFSYQQGKYPSLSSSSTSTSSTTTTTTP